MRASKWYLLQGENKFGTYAKIKEEDTDLIVAYFPAIKNSHDSNEMNERNKSLFALVDSHNEVVKALRKGERINSIKD